MNAVLLVLVAILGVQSFHTTTISNRSQTSLFLWGKKVSPTKKVVGPSAEQHATAFKYWVDLNGSMKETAPNFLTTEKCRSKFGSLAATVGTIEGALLITQADPGILNFSEERVAESYAAWCAKLESPEKVLELCIRNPPVLSLRARAVEQTTTGDVAQTIFWSYFAVTTRPVSLALGKAIRSIIN
ncbi:hypothetical protein B484DRAFT_460156 [Ochromonadaceae sp. CCMP2298]|nr:hypothetical protein B484DRAFT_460156 [Ochromonadaceae sp. CCMP2298]